MPFYQILLADDDWDDRTMFREALEETSSEVELVTVEDGLQLMKYLAAVQQPPPPNIIFLDINMPGKTGDQCLKEIRSNEKFNDTPVVMFSTSSHHHDIDRTYSAGANMYVSKSIFFQDDIRNLKRILATDWNDWLVNRSRLKYVFG